MTTNDTGGRMRQALGLAAFVCGIGVIAAVLRLAFALLGDPKAGIPDVGPAAPASAMALGAAFARLLVRIAVASLACLGGSLIAGKGIQLLLTASKPARPEPPA